VLSRSQSICYLLKFSHEKVRLNEHTPKNEDQNLLDSVGDMQAELKSLTALRETIAHTVILAAAEFWTKSKSEAIDSGIPLESNDVRISSSRRALEHILDAKSGRNVLMICALELDRKYFLRHLERIYTSSRARFVLSIVVWLHIYLSLWQSNFKEVFHSRESTPQSLAIEFLFLTIESTAVFIRLSLVLQSSPRLRNFVEKVTLGKSKESSNSFSSSPEYAALRDKGLIPVRRLRIGDILLFKIMVFLWLEFIGAFLSFQFRFSFLLKILLLILTNEHIQSSFHIFVITIVQTALVLGFYFTVWIISALLANIIFAPEILDTNLEDNEISNSFSTSIRSFLTMFAFLTNADNFNVIASRVCTNLRF